MAGGLAPWGRCHEAWVHHRTTPALVEARNPHKPGAARLRRALGSDVTLSELFTYGDVAETGAATVAELQGLLWPA